MLLIHTDIHRIVSIPLARESTHSNYTHITVINTMLEKAISQLMKCILVHLLKMIHAHALDDALA